MAIRSKDNNIVPLQRPLYSLEAEQSTLGGLMLDNSAWPKVASLVAEEDFYHADHRLIFQAIRSLATEGRPFDLVTLAEWLERHGHLDDAGGFAYFGLLARDTPSAVNVVTYAGIVRHKSLERQRTVAVAKGDFDRVTAITAAINALEAGVAARSRLVTIDAVLDRAVTCDWLVEGWIERLQTVVLWGESQTYKTLLAIEIACAIATGTPWRGCDTKEGAVLYIVGEGAGSGIARRFRAWQIVNQIDLRGRPIIFRETSTVLPDDTAVLIMELREFLDTRGWKLELVILDTLNRTMAGNESSIEDFSRYQRALDQIRDTFLCTIMFIHHTGHTDKARARGASSIRCNADVELSMEVIGEKTRRLHAWKIKDANPPDDMIFALAQVGIDQIDQKGDPITSVVIRQLKDYIPVQSDSSGKDAKAAFTILERIYAQQRTNLIASGYSDGQVQVTVADWRAEFISSLPVETKPATKRKAWERARAELTALGKVYIIDGFARIVDQA